MSTSKTQGRRGRTGGRAQDAAGARRTRTLPVARAPAVPRRAASSSRPGRPTPAGGCRSAPLALRSACAANRKGVARRGAGRQGVVGGGGERYAPQSHRSPDSAVAAPPLHRQPIVAAGWWRVVGLRQANDPTPASGPPLEGGRATDAGRGCHPCWRPRPLSNPTPRQPVASPSPFSQRAGITR